MSNTFLRSICGMVAVATLCTAPVSASQQDDESHKRRPPATAATAATTAPAAAVPASRSTVAQPAVVRKYQVTASEGRIIPGHIRARRGDVVRITFVSTDDTYGIRFKDFGVKQKLTPDKPVVVELHPTVPGTFEFRCTRTWGVSHWTHNGALEVE
jgi:heme/copper-type cytochrome/quinol oxidase subunit 2